LLNLVRGLKSNCHLGLKKSGKEKQKKSLLDLVEPDVSDEYPSSETIPDEN